MWAALYHHHNRLGKHPFHRFKIRTAARDFRVAMKLRQEIPESTDSLSPRLIHAEPGYPLSLAAGSLGLPPGFWDHLVGTETSIFDRLRGSGRAKSP